MISTLFLLAGLEYILYYHVRARAHNSAFIQRRISPEALELSRRIRDLAHSVYIEAGSGSDLEQMASRIDHAFREYSIDPMRAYYLKQELSPILGRGSLTSSVSSKVEELYNLLTHYTSVYHY